MKVVITDGGRKAAGFIGRARGDCVARSVAIVSGLPYLEVYARLSRDKGLQRATKRSGKQRANASEGIHVKRKWFRDYMAELGLVWTPTMGIGTGCKVHLRDGELPAGRLIVCVSKHYTAVIDGVIHDTHQPDRGGTRCVYGYWSKP